MPDYLSRAACKGHHPRNRMVGRHIERPTLVAKLMRERHVARFIVAPDGFGKTQVALEYAETVFSFAHVFWLDGTSPCFLRDLDKGFIATTLLESDQTPFLVVFEDVPLLDSERVDRLSHDLDCLLERGCEVLVTCTPTCDAFDRHHDRIKLGPQDLLLTDEELDAFRSPLQRTEQPAARISPAHRVAGIAWGMQNGKNSFLVQTLTEELPAELLLIIWTMVLLLRGTLDDVRVFARCDVDQLHLLAQRYPYLGIDAQTGNFETAEFSVEDIEAAFSARMRLIVERSMFQQSEMLVERVCDTLEKRRYDERACDVARLFMTRTARAQWLAQHGFELVERNCLLAACQVYRSLAGDLGDLRYQIDAAQAARLAALGNATQACRLARRVAHDAQAPLRERVIAAIILAQCSGAEECERSNALIAALVSMARKTLFSPEDVSLSSTAADKDACAWVAAASVHATLAKSAHAAADRWVHWYQRGARGVVMMHAAAWVLHQATKIQVPSLIGGSASDDASPQTAHALDEVAIIVRGVLESQSAAMGLAEMYAGAAFERACERGIIAQALVDIKVTHALQRVESELVIQRNEYERKVRERAKHHELYEVTHPNVFRPTTTKGSTSASSRLSWPLLTINLFGGFQVYIGQQVVDPALFRRQKVKTLLALLVLNRGKEFARDKLVTLLWPNSNLDSARKNFYSVWSMLRRALGDANGECPYLVRQQNGLRIEPTLVISDVDQFEEVCRSLLFERADFGGWANLYDQINSKFSDDLLPSDDASEEIDMLRVDYRNRLVDALVAASSRLVAAGDVQEGLWFARAALQRDRTREDAYTVLMRAQVAASQRTAALETYFACRRFLADELGIDPSSETMSLYRDIIETEMVLE